MMLFSAPLTLLLLNLGLMLLADREPVPEDSLIGGDADEVQGVLQEDNICNADLRARKVGVLTFKDWIGGRAG
jgi:hypothetical protein